MTRSQDNPWLHRFAVLTTLSTLGLIGMGGLVTSHGAGMAVPDWPTTYGYNMFLFPISMWKGGIFYEHSHRLWASAVGLLTVILSVWLWLGEERKWLRWMGVGAVLAVSFQGLLGGLRVTMFKDEIGVFHATLAQLFFLMLGLISLFTSAWWVQRSRSQTGRFKGSREWTGMLAVSSVILLQLILGATMRHQHAGLAVPDFPTAYGGWWPPMDSNSIDAINRARVDVRDPNPITSTHLVVHMLHRITAFVILASVMFMSLRVVRRSVQSSVESRLAYAWLGLIVLQLILGIVTVLRNKPADIATLHVVTGALSLVVGGLLTAVACRFGVCPEPVKSAKGNASLEQSPLQVGAV